MLTIGLTGGIGSGKSTVAKLFSNLGVPVYDTDTISRQLVEPGQPALHDIIESFGNDVINRDGTLDRQQLKQRVFSDKQARLTLESILHPRIKDTLLAQIASCEAAYCIVVIPLLLEKNWHSVVDRILVVDVSEKLQMNRATERDQVTESNIKQIMRTQVDRQTRLAAADDVIDNNDGPDALKEQVEQLHHQYLALARDAK